MKNSNTYENIKNELVSQVLESYEQYSNDLESLFDKVIEKKKHIENTDSITESYIEDSIGLEDLMLLEEGKENQQTLELRLHDVQNHFIYLNEYINEIDKFRKSTKELSENANELYQFNSIVKEEFDHINDSSSIFHSVMNNDKFDENIYMHIDSLQDYMRLIDIYLKTKNIDLLNELVDKKGEDYLINFDLLHEKELSLVKVLFIWLRNELDFKKYVDDNNKSRNYLKYDLLFR